jgi:CheY-like chemotaxis protein
MAKRIVVVDDDPKVRELIEWTLRPPEFEVLAFGDARDALARLPAMDPHLIICDMIMPDMDGRMFLKLVKRSDRLRDVPFLFLTAVRVGAEVQAAFDAGAAAFLVKPFPVARLVRTIRDVLEGEAAPANPLVPPPRTAPIRERPPVPRRAAPPPPRIDLDAPSSRVDPELLQEPTDEDFTEMLAGGASGAEAAPAPPTTGPLRPAGPVTPAPPAVERPSAPAVPRVSSPRPAPPPPAVPVIASAPPLERPPVTIEGRFSAVELEGVRVQVMTEAESRPNFVITTVVSRDGQGVRRIETCWTHPLKRQEDLDIVRRQIDLQHERVLDEIRRGPLQGPRRRAVWTRDKRSAGG